METPLALQFEPKTTGATTGRILAFKDEKICFADKLNLAARNDRARTVNGIMEKRLPNTSPYALESTLLKILQKQINIQNQSPSNDRPDQDINIVKPAQCFTENLAATVVFKTHLNENRIDDTCYLIGSRRTAPQAKPERFLEPFKPAMNINGEHLYLTPRPFIQYAAKKRAWNHDAQQEWLDGKDDDGNQIFNQLRDTLDQYIVLNSACPDEQRTAIALWIMATYLYNAFPQFPYLHLTGSPDSGKSRLLDLIECFAFNPINAAAITPVALMRILNKNGGTALFDNADRLSYQYAGASELQTILLAGYRTDTPICRANARSNDIRQYDVYGPKAIVSIEPLPPSLASRTILIEMEKCDPDSLQSTCSFRKDQFQNIRDQLHGWALEFYWKIKPHIQNQTPIPEITLRENRLCFPLLLIARQLNLDTEYKQMIRLILRNRSSTLSTLSPLDELIIHAYAKCHQMYPMGFSPADIENWITKTQSDLGPLSPKKIARTLIRYGILTKKNNGKRRYTNCIIHLKHLQKKYNMNFNEILETPSP